MQRAGESMGRVLPGPGGGRCWRLGEKGAWSCIYRVLADLALGFPACRGMGGV